VKSDYQRGQGRLSVPQRTVSEPCHTLNAALFPAARFHDHMAICRDDVREDRDADGYRLSAPITLIPPAAPPRTSAPS